MLHTGAFHTGLRAAVEARGLSLSRIRDKLADQGHAVSVSTLSNWQRGVSRPGGDARRVLSALETVLQIDAGSLAATLDPAPAAGRWRELGPGTSPRRIKELRYRLGFTDDSGLTVVSAMDDVTVAPAQRVRQTRIRLVLRADQDGADRHLVFVHVNHRRLPTFRAVADCDLAQTATDEEAGLACAELRFAPMARGETCPIEYQVESTADDSYYGRWIRTADLRFELTVRFEPGSRVRSAHRVWRTDAHSPHKDVAPLRLIGKGLAHMIEADPNPGFHGIRWE